MNQASMIECCNFSKRVYSDASKAGFGGYEVSTVNGIAHGQWTSEESVQSSTWRELVAVYRVFKRSLCHILSMHKVKRYLDNQTITSIVRKGSMKPELQCID